MKSLSNIYRGKKVLVTGDSGFKGSWLVLWLQKLGAEICGFSHLPPSNPSHAKLLNLNYSKNIGDICDLDSISKVITKFKPEIIFHLAAQPLVRKSYKFPLKTFETNIIGTANLLETVRVSKFVKAVVIITTDKCYENRENGKPFVETDSLGGFDPYSASKGAAEIVVSSYRNSFFKSENFGKSHNTLVATARAGNVIGGGDWGEDRLLPDIMKATSQSETVEIRSPNAVRPWQFVLEPLLGYLLLGEKLLLGDKKCATSWNFGPEINDHKIVGEVVEVAKKEWKELSFNLATTKPDLHEATLLSLNCEKAKKQLGWSPIWNSESAIRESVIWYKNYYHNKNLVSEVQLENFIKDAELAKIKRIS